MWLLVERFTILPFVVVGAKSLVIGGVNFPDFLAIGSVFGNSLHSTAILIKDGISGIGTMTFFRQLYGSFLL